MEVDEDQFPLCAVLDAVPPLRQQFFAGALEFPVQASSSAFCALGRKAVGMFAWRSSNSSARRRVGWSSPSPRMNRSITRMPSA